MVGDTMAGLRKRLVRIRRDPVVARRRGGLFLLDPHNWIDNRLLARAAYENRQLASALTAIADNELDLLVDIGANFGLYSVVLGRLDAIKDIVAFEPVSRNFSQLHANLYLNGIDRKTTAHRLAVGASPSRQTIHIDPRSTGLARFDLATAERDTRVFLANETIDVVRFDDVVSLRGRRAFVKIDVEGSAAGVLLGMRRFLTDNPSFVQVELSTSEATPCRAQLAEIGYREITMIERDAVFCSPSLSPLRPEASQPVSAAVSLA